MDTHFQGDDTIAEYSVSYSGWKWPLSQNKPYDIKRHQTKNVRKHKKSRELVIVIIVIAIIKLFSPNYRDIREHHGKAF